MSGKTSFPLRIQAQERERGKRLAESLGISENRLYAELIHDGMLVREQMLYMARLHHIAETTTVADALAVLDLVPSHPPVPTDRI